MTEREEVAVILHKLFCSSNHIDQCDWEYGKFESWAGKYALKEADEFLSNGGKKEQLEILVKVKRK